MTEIDEEQKPDMITEMSARGAAQIILGGAVAGLIAGGLTLLFSMYLFRVLPCAIETCGAGGQYSAVLAGIISAAFGLFWLIRLQVFRPLLIVIAVTIALWGLALQMIQWPWYAIVLATAGAHALAYLLFAWISRLRLFWAVLILLVLIIASIRFILAS